MSNFWDLVNIEEFWDKRVKFNLDRWEISFYCRDCKKIVETTKLDPDKYKYKCNICSGENISIWTSEWLKVNYKIK